MSTIDKYDDLCYGNTFKTPYSVFTVREIEMMCRKMGWNHIEHFKKKWPDQAPQNFVCRCDVGYFDDKYGREFITTTTFRTSWWKISPYDTKKKEELMKSLTSEVGLVKRWYPLPWRDYYFYDVIFLDPWKEKEEEFCKLILSHAGVGKTDGVLWSHNKKGYEV